MGSQPQTRRASGRHALLLVDDHPIVLEGLLQQLGRESDLRVCGSARTAAQAVAAVEAERPDLVLVDLNLPGRGGLELIRDLLSLKPGLRMLVLSMHDEDVFAERALRAGARGYVSKQAGGDVLLRAIRKVLDGGIYVSDEVSTRLLDSLGGRSRGAHTVSPVEQLTDRELEVFAFIGRALETRAIARSMGVSVKTVEAHRASIKRKLKLRTGPELTRHAVLWVEATQ